MSRESYLTYEQLKYVINLKSKPFETYHIKLLVHGLLISFHICISSHRISLI